MGGPAGRATRQQPQYQAAFPTDCQPVTSAVVTFPLYTYDHSLGSAAAVGGTFFTGAQYPAAYTGNFFFADYPRGWMKRIVFDGSGNVQSVVDFASNIGDGTGGLVAIELGPDGLLYYVVFTTGEIARIRNTVAPGRISRRLPPPRRRRPPTAILRSRSASPAPGRQTRKAVR